ncbi:hypothetical protein ERO13_D05G260100v2 [Gossypium hirsutum]|uniref:CYP722 protein n=1 Tax=Gossypium hirsutum TaxID=3635 RepID=A0A1U8J1K2_GOSHI|nr:uncharacterized protein LOC107902573 [Gossypium hirsutum]KAG4148015.1 hypothetical protein ERO13_D05G260100v2 [Gossypium hirsutum]
MASFEFDNVKAEKEDALWRYNMEKKLKIGLRLTGFLLALFLFAWSWFPTFIPGTLEVTGDFRRRLVSAFNEPLFTFVLVNFIIVVVYILSGGKHTQKQTTSTDIYDEYVGSYRWSILRSTVATVVPAAEESMVDKQIVHVEKAVPPVSLVKQLEPTVETVRETKTSLSPVEQPTTTTTANRTVPTKKKPAVSSTEVREKEYLRSQSTISESVNQRAPIEFRRSETSICEGGGGETVVSGIEPRRKSMEEMSNEEFQRIIDSFIAERKKTLLQENTAHYTSTKEKCMPILLKH